MADQATRGLPDSAQQVYKTWGRAEAGWLTVRARDLTRTSFRVSATHEATLEDA